MLKKSFCWKIRTFSWKIRKICWKIEMILTPKLAKRYKIKFEFKYIFFICLSFSILFILNTYFLYENSKGFVIFLTNQGEFYWLKAWRGFIWAEAEIYFFLKRAEAFCPFNKLHPSSQLQICAIRLKEQKKFYTRGTLRSLKISRLAKSSTL